MKGHFLCVRVEVSARLMSLPTHQMQQPSHWAYASKLDAVCTPPATLHEASLHCSSMAGMGRSQDIHSASQGHSPV